MKKQTKNLFYVISGYPVVTHTFLYNQISDVLEYEHLNVKIIVFNKQKGEIHEVYKCLDDKVVHISIGTGQTFFKRMFLILTSFFSLLFSRPILLLRALNVIRYGRNSSNLNYLILSNHFRKIDADLFHCHFGPTAALISDLKDIGAITCKMISSFHGMDISVNFRNGGRGFYDRLFKVCDMFTGNSTYTIKRMTEKGCPIDRTFKVPMGINLDQFKYRGDRTTVVGAFNILTVGRLVEKKGHEYSLKALGLFHKRGIPFQYHIIGEGPLKDDLVILSIELGINESVVFHGAMKQEQLLPFYHKCDLFLMPSVTAANGDTEGQGLVLQEAQAIGVPVLATIHNGFPDSVIDGKTGFLVPERDAEALYEKIVLINAKRELRAQMGSEGRVFVEKTFDSKIVVKSLVELYDSLC